MATNKVYLTEKYIQSPKRVPKAGRVHFRDSEVPGMSVRVTANGTRTYTLTKRYPLHPEHPAPRALGEVGEISLADAREKARKWQALIKRGIDPKVDAARERALQQQAQIGTFANLWNSYFSAQGQKLAHADECRLAGVGFVRAWGDRPATELLPLEVAVYIRDLAKRTPGTARNAFGHLSRAFSWAIGSGFGISVNPCRALRPADLLGAKVARDRILSDPELRAVWGASEAAGYPYGPLTRLLLLSGQRLAQIAELQWREIDFEQRRISFSPARMKMKTAFILPLAPDALALLRSLPRFTGGDYVFSSTHGRTSVTGFSRAKVKLDALSGVSDPPWTFHDLRRSMRSHLSALPVQDVVREATIAHARKGISKVYDLHTYADEKRECLELWEARLRGILAPPTPADVTDLDAERERRHASTSTA